VEAIDGRYRMKSVGIKCGLALAAVMVLAFAGVAEGKLHLTKQKAYNSNLAHAKGFCTYLNDNYDPDIGNCTKATGKCPKRLGPTAFSCTQRFDLTDSTGPYYCTNRTKVTLRRGVGVRTKSVPDTLKCYSL
jgi:hypothetical protein